MASEAHHVAFCNLVANILKGWPIRLGLRYTVPGKRSNLFTCELINSRSGESGWRSGWAAAGTGAAATGAAATGAAGRFAQLHFQIRAFDFELNQLVVAHETGEVTDGFDVHAWPCRNAVASFSKFEYDNT